VAIRGSRAAGSVDSPLLATVGIHSSLDQHGLAKLILHLGILRSQGQLEQPRSLVIGLCRHVVSDLLLTTNFQGVSDPNDWHAYKKYVQSVARRIEQASSSLASLEDLFSPPPHDRMRLERLRRRAAEIHRIATDEITSDPLGLRDEGFKAAVRQVRRGLRTMSAKVDSLNREVAEMRRRPKALNLGNQLALQLCPIWFAATAKLPMISPARRETEDDPFYEFCKLVAGLAPPVDGRSPFPLSPSAVEHVARRWRDRPQLNADDRVL